MIYVRMSYSHGACCATGELCSFSTFDEEWCRKYKRIFPGRNPAQAIIEYEPHRNELINKGYAHSGDKYYGKGETVEEAWNNCLKAVQKHVQGYSYEGQQLRYFWFVQYDSDRELDEPVEGNYQNEPLRRIVQQLPNVVKLGVHRNANSNNFVDGYMAIFTKE